VSFVLVDRVDVLEPHGRAAGVKFVQPDDPVFVDHFPEHPLYPGTLIVEAMAQLGGLLAEASWHYEHDHEHDHEPAHNHEPDTRRAVLMQVDRAKFHRPCRPGQTLQLECAWESMLGHAVQLRASAALVGDVSPDPIATASLTFKLVAVDAPTLHAHRRELYRRWTAHWPSPPTLR
jgi:3-hydroxyacyl-[acyl-carrier-protein] dehydratase